MHGRFAPLIMQQVALLASSRAKISSQGQLEWRNSALICIQPGICCRK
jgi:hypothetical protein